MVGIEDNTECKKEERRRAQQVKGLAERIFGAECKISSSDSRVHIKRRRSLLSNLLHPSPNNTITIFYQSVTGKGNFIVYDPKFFDKTRQVAEEYKTMIQEDVIIRLDYSARLL